MDVIFKRKSSSYKVDANGEDIRLLIKGENNEEDPMGIYRIVKFNVLGKNRRIQWMEFDSALLGSEETTNGGYLNFVGRKYGEQSYILTIPASEVAEGEYGVFYLDIITAAVIPVGTFSVKIVWINVSFALTLHHLKQTWMHMLTDENQTEESPSALHEYGCQCEVCCCECNQQEEDERPKYVSIYPFLQTVESDLDMLNDWD
jgi:hypothetical protein